MKWKNTQKDSDVFEKENCLYFFCKNEACLHTNATTLICASQRVGLRITLKQENTMRPKPMKYFSPVRVFLLIKRNIFAIFFLVDRFFPHTYIFSKCDKIILQSQENWNYNNSFTSKMDTKYFLVNSHPCMQCLVYFLLNQISFHVWMKTPAH